MLPLILLEKQGPYLLNAETWQGDQPPGSSFIKKTLKWGWGCPAKMHCRKCPSSINIFMAIKVGTFLPECYSCMGVMYESIDFRYELPAKNNRICVYNFSRVCCLLFVVCRLLFVVCCCWAKVKSTNF
jgi:hypothetical protein